MRLKILVAIATLFSTTTLFAYCSNAYEVSREALCLENNATDLSYEARHFGMHNIARLAKQLGHSASHLELIARSNSDCTYLKREYSRTVQYDYRNLQEAYQRSGRYNNDLSYEMRRVAESFRDLSSTVRILRDDYYEPIPRHPGRYEPPRARVPRHTPPPHHRRHRRYDPPARRRGGISIPAGRRHRNSAPARSGRRRP